MLAVSLLLTAGWWVLRSPLVERGRHGIAGGDAHLEAMRENAASSETSPEGAVALASARVASAPASAASGQLCGDEQRPEVTLIRKGPFMMPVVTKPASVTYTAAQARLDAALRSSADPFDGAVADLLNVGDMRTPSGVLDALVEDAITSDDPRVYSLARNACADADAREGPPVDGPPPPPSCATLSVRRWAQLDSGNGVPWLLMLQQSEAAGDVVALEDALAHLAAARRFEGRLYSSAGAVLRHDPGRPEEGAAVDDLATHTIALNPVASTLTHLCKHDTGVEPARLAQCETIATTLFDHSDEQSLRAQGAAVTFAVTGDPARKNLVRAERERMETRAKATTAALPCETQRIEVKTLVREAQVGEVEAMRELASASATR